MSRATGATADRGRPTLDDVIAVVGVDIADRLSEVFGGRRLSIPRHPGIDSPLARAVGLDAACAIGHAFGGEAIDVPIQAGRRTRAARLLAAGWSVSRVAQAVGWTERQVWRVKADVGGPDHRQLDLFG